jgi:predicted nucleic acid-binding protein
MYLLDTNIFLEILLQRENSKAAKHLFIANPYTDLFVTDFSLHSIGVFLFQRNRHETYVSFVKDVIIKTGITVIGLDPEDVLALAEVSKNFRLDFDDAYQYAVAQKYGLKIMSFDADFDRTEKGRKIPELK